MKILIIDDDAGLRKSVRLFLEDCGHGVILAADGQEGLDALAQNPGVDLALVDLTMPVLDGYGFIKQARQRYADLPLVVLSGVGVLEDAMQAVRLGAWDFVSKPILNFDVLLHAIDSADQKAKLMRENARYQAHLEEMVQKRTAQLEQANERVVHCLGKAAEFRDNDTGHHVMRVGEIAAILAESMGLAPPFCRMIRLAAPMHDIGKISVPDNILLKPGPLSDQEWEIMKRHAAMGCEMLHFDPELTTHGGCTLSLLLALKGQDDLICMAQKIALCHHERYDGKGYPHGLKGEDIPVEARIVSLVDVYDALGSARSYKSALPEEVCRQTVVRASGTYFDPKVVTAFVREYDRVAAVRLGLAD